MNPINAYVAGPDNLRGEYMLLERSTLGVTFPGIGNSQAVVLASHRVTLDAAFSPIFMRSRIGVTYMHEIGMWAVMTQDRSTIPLGARFDVTSYPAPNETAFIHTVTSANCVNNTTWLSHPLVDENEQAVLFVTPFFDHRRIQVAVRRGAKDIVVPQGRPVSFAMPAGVRVNHNVGVWFNSSTGLWNIFYQDYQPIEVGTKFFVEAFVASGDWIEHIRVVLADSSNTDFRGTRVILAGGTGTEEGFIVTPNISAGLAASDHLQGSPGLAFGSYNDHTVGLMWDYDAPRGSTRMIIVNEDESVIPNGAGFNTRE